MEVFPMQPRWSCAVVCPVCCSLLRGNQQGKGVASDFKTYPRTVFLRSPQLSVVGMSEDEYSVLTDYIKSPGTHLEPHNNTAITL